MLRCWLRICYFSDRISLAQERSRCAFLNQEYGITDKSICVKSKCSRDFSILGLTQLAYFSCRVCDAAKIFERSNETCSVTHQPPIVTLA
ncbi:MAG TPA: hypothetical protein V6D25_25145 [Leptolyngbyaceae cyanobacterium]